MQPALCSCKPFNKPILLFYARFIKTLILLTVILGLCLAACACLFLFLLFHFAPPRFYYIILILSNFVNE